MADDIVFEIKVRFSGLTYDEARELRDALRQPDDESMIEIVEELKARASELVPEKREIKAFTPWAEWRPARGRRRD